MPEHQQTQQSKNTESSSQRLTVLPRRVQESNPAAIIQLAKIDPKSLTPTDVLQLQRTIGNRAVGRLLSEIRSQSAIQQVPIQRQKLEEEACPSCVQRGTSEEEKPLQGKMIGTVQCQEIPEEKEPLQTKKENNIGMPDNLKAGVENLSGIDMSDVRVHYNSSKPAEVGALAYTQGTDIHVAPGQERHLPHEAWHVVQQAQGRVKPTMQLKDVVVNDNAGLEKEADVMGANAVKINGGLQEKRYDLVTAAVKESHGMEGTIQRVLEYKGEKFKTMKEIASSKTEGVWKAWSDYKATDKMDKLTSTTKLYDLANGLAFIRYMDPITTGPTVESKVETQPSISAPKRNFALSTKPYIGDKGYDVTVDEGAGFLSTDAPEILATGGLNGCLAVMIEVVHGKLKGYFLAHVSSEHVTEEAVNTQAKKILRSVSELVGSEVKWTDFGTETDTERTSKITLVRSGAGPAGQQTYEQMSSLLRKKKAPYSQAVYNKVFFDLRSGSPLYGTMIEGRHLMDEVRRQKKRTVGYGTPKTEEFEIRGLTSRELDLLYPGQGFGVWGSDKGK